MITNLHCQCVRHPPALSGMHSTTKHCSCTSWLLSNFAEFKWSWIPDRYHCWRSNIIHCSICEWMQSVKAELEELQERKRKAYAELIQKRSEIIDQAVTCPHLEADCNTQLQVLALIKGFLDKHFCWVFKFYIDRYRYVPCLLQILFCALPVVLRKKVLHSPRCSFVRGGRYTIKFEVTVRYRKLISLWAADHYHNKLCKILIIAIQI